MLIQGVKRQRSRLTGIVTYTFTLQATARIERTGTVRRHGLLRRAVPRAQLAIFPERVYETLIMHLANGLRIGEKRGLPRVETLIITD